MIPAGVATALAAALVFGVYLAIYKRSFDALPATVYTAVNEAAGFGWYLVIAALTWPLGEPVVPPEATVADLVLLGGVGLVIAAANLVSVRAFKLGDVSFVAPLNKLVPVFVLPVELVVLTADIGPLQVLGVGLAAVAIYRDSRRVPRSLPPRVKPTRGFTFTALGDDSLAWTASMRSRRE